MLRVTFGGTVDGPGQVDHERAAHDPSEGTARAVFQVALHRLPPIRRRNRFAEEIHGLLDSARLDFHDRRVR
jgi:hypothetical protein